MRSTCRLLAVGDKASIALIDMYMMEKAIARTQLAADGSSTCKARDVLLCSIGGCVLGRELHQSLDDEAQENVSVLCAAR